ncbi:aminopeptidase P family protein, partial [Thermococci archaeon]
TIEPGIYIPGRVGVRIEDDVAIINGKGKRLTKAGKELIVL